MHVFQAIGGALLRPTVALHGKQQRRHARTSLSQPGESGNDMA
jgi:hypothetical protein